MPIRSALVSGFASDLLRLNLQTSELYEQTLTASQKEFPTTASYLPAVSPQVSLALSPLDRSADHDRAQQSWTALMTIKKFHFSAVAHCESIAVQKLDRWRVAT